MSQESERFNRIRRDIGTLLSVSSGLGDLARDNLIYWLNGTGLHVTTTQQVLLSVL